MSHGVDIAYQVSEGACGRVPDSSGSGQRIALDNLLEIVYFQGWGTGLSKEKMLISSITPLYKELGVLM